MYALLMWEKMNLWICNWEEGKDRPLFFSSCLALADLVRNSPRLFRKNESCRSAFLRRRSRQTVRNLQPQSASGGRQRSFSFLIRLLDVFTSLPSTRARKGKGRPSSLGGSGQSLTRRQGSREGADPVRPSFSPGHRARSPWVPPSGARGRVRPRAALFQHGAGGGGSSLPAPLVPAPSILVPE